MGNYCCLGAKIPGYGHSRNCLGQFGHFDEAKGTVVKEQRKRLYMDIDGVLYAHYGGQWQLRPYIVTLTRWAKKHFDIHWVSYNSAKENVVDASYAEGKPISNYWAFDENDKLIDPGWHKQAARSGKLQAIYTTGGFEGDWLMVEDTPPDPVQTEILTEMGCLWRWLVIPDTGSDTLLDLKGVLESYIETNKLRVPFEWATRNVVERDFDLNADWEGFKP